MVDALLATMDKEFEAVHAKTGRPSAPAKRRLKSMRLQILFSIRAERILIERTDDSVPYRWFVGLTIDEPVWATRP